MTILSRRFKLEYNDATEGTTVIAETDQDTGALKIDRHVQIRRQKDPDILKLWLEGSNFGDAIPTRKSEFGQAQNGTDEPEILYKQYDPDTDSFVTQGRYYAKNTGTINEDGELALKLYSFHKFTARQSVDTVTTDTNIEDALNTVLPTGYVADVPAGATPPSVDGYSINARREKGYHELTRDYKWTLTFTGELDANNNYKVKYEPEGFGGTVDTIIENTQAGKYRIIAVDTTNNIFTVSGDRTDELVVNQEIQVINSTGNDGTFTINTLSYDSTNNETDITVDENISDSTADGSIIPGGQAVFKSWEKDKTDAIINKVTVEGTSTSTGDTITATATNQTQIDNFGEKFRKIKRGYIESSTDAQNIAESYLVPGLDEKGNDITKVPENGTVKTTAYSDNIVNDSFQVVGNKRNIDDTYTVAQQRNFWPEGATEIEFEFEQENLEEAARDAENLRDERGRLYPSTKKSLNGETGFTQPGVAGNTGDTSPDVAGNTGDTSPDVAGNTGDTSPNVLGTSDNDGGSTEIAATETDVTNVDAPEGNFVNLGSFSGDSSDTEGATVYIGVDVKYNDDVVTNNGDFLNTNIDIAVNSSASGDIPSEFVATRAIFTFIDTDGDGATEVNTRDSIDVAITVPENTSGNTYDVNIRSNDLDVVFSGKVTFVEYDQHSHGSGTYDADNHPHDDGTLDADNHPHDDGTLDADNHPHDDGTLDADDHPHQSGSLEAEVAEENKTDR